MPLKFSKIKRIPVPKVKHRKLNIPKIMKLAGEVKKAVERDELKFSKSKQVGNKSTRTKKVAGKGIKRSKKPNKQSVSKLKKQLMLLVKAYVHKRDSDICQHCHKHVTGSNCQVSHVIPVSHGNRLAFEPTNMKILCYHCHLNWWHKNPIEATEWFKIVFDTRWEWLNEHKNETVDWNAEDYKIKIEEAKLGNF